MVLAHVAGVPVEELIPTVAGAGSVLLLAPGWVALRLRRHRAARGMTDRSRSWS